MGRSLKKIDPEQVKELARIGCDKTEIARMLGCHRDTIRDRFSTQFELGEARGKIELRRKQHKRAFEDESDSMLMFLGKHRLGQEDRTKAVVEHAGELRVIVEYTDGDPDSAAPEPASIGVGHVNGSSRPASRSGFPGANEPFPAAP
jgi:hypothetical protein